MKIEKSKIVFVSILVVIVVFLVCYTIIITREDKDENNKLQQITVPALEEETQEVYDSKLEAINDIKEEREKNVPSIYQEELIDSLGYYDPELNEKEKQRFIDSIYTLGEKRSVKLSAKDIKKTSEVQLVKESDPVEIQTAQRIDAKEMGLEHQLFFASAPPPRAGSETRETDAEILVVVDGTQVVKANSRLRMRLAAAATINNKHIPKNTPIFGFISFQPNRVLIEIEHVNHQPTDLKAFDLQDGSQGIYVENNFRAEASTEVLDDLLGEINIPSVPQISGIGKVLRRNNRAVKVTVLNNYKLLLRPGQ
ncbi:uncharacterized protein DUF3714 [Salegentibacter sp. 24]|uniref:conjugative transposon protein TraM n=1 Tax=Salegentibacter sp. 24 TaxID=2183986 RepID=UPI00105F5F06|nr:conjugative transposon protein TraM [Salegentibacter sp. 24]TDN95003.1 uncharacterized protein DUF3714 [Salegentibacter sp. 24]